MTNEELFEGRMSNKEMIWLADKVFGKLLGALSRIEVHVENEYIGSGGISPKKITFTVRSE